MFHRLFISFFVLLLNVAFPFSRVHAELPFQEQIASLVEKSLRGRDGVVIFVDRLQKKQTLFGNAALANEKFMPGSLMKLVTAEAALAQGKMPTYRCSGHDMIGGRKMFCWEPNGHGELDLAKAISVSCNLYFAQLGSKLGLQTILDQIILSFPGSAWECTASKALSSLNGGGASKTVRSQAEPGNERVGVDVASLAIGDSPVFRMTPQEIMTYWDHLLTRIQNPAYAVIEQGLRRAVQEGTGQRASSESFEILGKTGTSDSQNSAYKTDGWFLGAYPVKNPRYLVIVFLKRAHGYEEAATLAGKIFALGVKINFNFFPSF